MKNAVILLVILITAGCNTVGSNTVVFKDTPSALEELTNSNIENKSYNLEDRNWNIPATHDYKNANYHSPTPSSHPTAKIITTYELSKNITSENKPVIVNVLGDQNKNNSVKSIPTSFWLTGFGRGPEHDDNTDHQRFTDQLAKLTSKNKNTPLVFFCLDSKCWLSYNACLRAAELGYSNVYWYRGGINSWTSAGLPLVSTGIYGK